MYQFKSKELLEIVKKIEALRDHADGQKQAIVAKYPTLDTGGPRGRSLKSK